MSINNDFTQSIKNFTPEGEPIPPVKASARTHSDQRGHAPNPISPHGLRPNWPPHEKIARCEICIARLASRVLADYNGQSLEP
jgi:hypothetical protein